MIFKIIFLPPVVTDTLHNAHDLCQYLLILTPDGSSQEPVQRHKRFRRHCSVAFTDEIYGV